MKVLDSYAILPFPVLTTILARGPPHALLASPEQFTLHVSLVPRLPYELPHEHVLPFCAPAYLSPYK